MRHIHKNVLMMIAAAAGIAACGSGSEPRLTGPATLQLDSAAAVSAAVGTTVTPAPVFIVRDSSGRPIPNVSVNFFASFGSTVTPTTVMTDDKGRARPSAWILGGFVGPATLTAQLSTNGSLSATATTTARPGPPALIILSQQSLALGLTDTATLSAVVTDVYHNTVGFTTVTYSSSNPAVASTSGNLVIAHSAGDAVITASVTGTTVSATIPVSVTERFGHLAGRPFGICFAHSQQDLLLVTSQDVHSLTSVNATTFAVGSSIGVGANPPDCIANSQGTLAYVTSVDGPQVTIVNLPAMTVAQTIPDQTTTRVLLSPDGSLLYVAKQGGIDVFSTATRALVSSVAIPSLVNGMALSADGSILWASTSFSGQVYRVTTSNMAITNSGSVGGTAQELVYHEASGTVYVANESGWVDVLKGSDLTALSRISNLSGAFGMRLSPDATKLYVAGSLAGRVYIVDRATGSIQKTVSVGGTPRRIVFLPDGRAAVVNEGAYISLVQ
jgi:YVTN family beta-propeller protein